MPPPFVALTDPQAPPDPLSRLPSRLVESSAPARLWSPSTNGRVRCHLSPRRCHIPEGGLGFCGVRHNQGGELRTLNYGKSVAMTRETIETEAVYHFAPGEAILSMGNIGCMMACDFCHNWRTSQARQARDADIHAYSPEDVVEAALRHGIRVLSWTYNDPVVWHEFVVDTARLAKKHGLINLYKSAFYITPEAVDELLEVIDIFSLSLKSMDPDFYRKHTKGRLEPTLEAIERVYRARAGGDRPHLELSNLCVTGRNDTLEEAARVARFVLDRLDPTIPLHYVRFHPDYRYTHVGRTDVGFLEAARAQAREMGVEHVYVGNVTDSPSAHTWCAECGTLLIERRGTAATLHLDGDRCPKCTTRAPIVRPFMASAEASMAFDPGDAIASTHALRVGVQALHVELPAEAAVRYQALDAAGEPLGTPRVETCQRFMIAFDDARAAAVRLEHPPGVAPRLYEVYDRAHFPTVDVATAVSPSADTPCPSLHGDPMDAVSRRIVDRLVDRIVRQPKPCDALLRFVYYTEEFVERYDIEGVLPHLTDDERDAMRKHFRDEMAHSVALRRYCQEEGLPIERSPLEEALIQRSDEGYAQYLRHLDPATNRFTPAEMYAYYAHVNVQEDVANVLYSAVANALERHGVHTRFVKLLRAFAKSEIKHQDYADDFMSKYEAQLGRAQCRRIYLRTRVQSLTLGAGYLREFLRILVVEHDLDIGPFGWLVRRLPAPAAAA